MQVLRETHALLFFRSICPVNAMAPTEPYIHRLPVELLQQMFLFIVNSGPDYPSIFSYRHDTFSVNVASPPLVLIRVCRLWRVVAHSTAGVWSRIQVELPGKVSLFKPLFKPFLPHILRCWLARSGNSPLTLRIVCNASYCKRTCYKIVAREYQPFLDILLSESRRWETIVMPCCTWGLNFDTPQLRVLACDVSTLSKFYAPNISCLCIDTLNSNLVSVRISSYKDLRHLHLRNASISAIYSAIASLPRLETIAVNENVYWCNIFGTKIYSATLELMTLPLPSFPYHSQQGFTNMFTLLHLPAFRKLTLVGALKKGQLDCLLSVLAAASFRVPAVDFQTDTPLRKVYLDRIESLLAVVGKVTFCGNVLQIDEYRNSRRISTRKPKLCFSI
ncbi:hypothetical protein BDR07DRAFT_1412478 [Suillus spraguei]|nr:hypothetical protein BDR07DRAFT_1412478 [Suillus spraguei]